MRDVLTMFLTGNEWWWRLSRTCAQGVLGVVVANLDLLVGASPVPVEFRAFAAALVMAVLSPVMAGLGEAIGDGGAE